MALSNKPVFTLTCVNSEYPHHLFVGCKYKVDVFDKNRDKESATYWFHPIENKWVLIGSFALTCFDLTPIREYAAKKNGTVEKSVEKPKVIEKPRTVERPK